MSDATGHRITARTADRLSRLGFELSNLAARLREAGVTDAASGLLAASKECHAAAEALAASHATGRMP